MVRVSRLLTVLAVVASLLVPVAASARAGWEFLGVQDGVKVYRKQVPGSDVFAFRGEIVADLHIGQILAVFLDPAERRHWVDRYAAQKTLERGKDHEVYWIKFGLPFPVSDRDYVLRADADVQPDKRVFVANIKSVNDPRKPKDDCCVRAQAYGTYYRFQAIPGQQRTKMEVEVHTDPKGMLPDWLVNVIQKGWPSKTLSGLIKRTRKAARPPHAQAANWHD